MKKAILALALTAMSGAAVAGPSWTYVDLGYLRSSTSEALAGQEDSQGYELLGSYGFADIWHISASYGSSETAFVGSSSDLEIDKAYNITGGVHPAITDNTDFVAEIGYTQWTVANTGLGTTPTADIEPTAISLTVGVRSMVSDAFELNAFLTSETGSTDTPGSDDYNNLIPSVGGQYFFTDNFSVNLNYAWANTDSLVLGSKDQARFGVRWSF